MPDQYFAGPSVDLAAKGIPEALNQPFFSSGVCTKFLDRQDVFGARSGGY